jgi:hypothetical protein
MIRRFPKLTAWRVIFAAIMLSGLYATYLRIVYGLGGATNLSDQFPWAWLRAALRSWPSCTSSISNATSPSCGRPS